jgi:integrase
MTSTPYDVNAMSMVVANPDWAEHDLDDGRASRATTTRARHPALGQENALVFCAPTGAPIDPRRDWAAWKALLRDAGVRDVRLHDARHTAATLLLVQGVAPRTVMDVMGWYEQRMLSRYQRVVDELRRGAADLMGAALWTDTTETKTETTGRRMI